MRSRSAAEGAGFNSVILAEKRNVESDVASSISSSRSQSLGTAKSRRIEVDAIRLTGESASGVASEVIRIPAAFKKARSPNVLHEHGAVAGAYLVVKTSAFVDGHLHVAV
jgi:hypothetical protein